MKWSILLKYLFQLLAVCRDRNISNKDSAFLFLFIIHFNLWCFFLWFLFDSFCLRLISFSRVLFTNVVAVQLNFLVRGYSCDELWTNLTL